jgi:hypothetical protein
MQDPSAVRKAGAEGVAALGTDLMKGGPMTTLHGLPLSQVLAHLGGLHQVARIDSLIDADGPSRGSRRVRVISGGGLEVELHPDRCLDIGQVTVDGIPVAWIEAGGARGPAELPADGESWLRAWGGGMLTTCGLDSYGAPCTDEGRDFGLHGRVSGIACSSLSTRTEGGSLIVEGQVRQSVVGGETLVLQRRIEVEIGGTSLTVSDVVTNESAHPSVHMILYHANFGWPLVEDGSTLSLPSAGVTPRDEASAPGAATWSRIQGPHVLHTPEVLLHDLREEQPVTVRVENPRIGLAMQLEFDRDQLPWLCQWNLFAERTYVLGLEPMNTRTVTSRADARAADALSILAPGESAAYRLRFSFERATPTSTPQDYLDVGP